MEIGNSGIDIAFCPLLWEANGGQLSAGGVPIISDSNTVRGNCKNPYDCAQCDILHSTLLSLGTLGVSSIWVCYTCSSEVRDVAKETGLYIRFPGYYTEGYCQRPACFRAQQHGDAGRYSAILQLLTVVGTDIP